MAPRLITRKEAAALVGVSPERVSQLVREGKFPRPRKAGTIAQAPVRFVKSEVEGWLRQRYGLEAL